MANAPESVSHPSTRHATPFTSPHLKAVVVAEIDRLRVAEGLKDSEVADVLGYTRQHVQRLAGKRTESEARWAARHAQPDAAPVAPDAVGIDAPLTLPEPEPEDFVIWPGVPHPEGRDGTVLVVPVHCLPDVFGVEANEAMNRARFMADCGFVLRSLATGEVVITVEVPGARRIRGVAFTGCRDYDDHDFVHDRSPRLEREVHETFDYCREHFYGYRSVSGKGRILGVFHGSL